MQPDDRAAFEKILEEIFGALDKPLTEAKRQAFWTGLQKLSLVEFSRCRDRLIADMESGEKPKTFGVSDVWALKRRLRAAVQAKPVEQPWNGTHALRVVNLLFYRWLAAEIPKRKPLIDNHTPQIVGKPRSIPNAELAERRQACIELAEAEEMMRAEGHESFEKLQESFDRAMARIPALPPDHESNRRPYAVPALNRQVRAA